LIVDTSLFIILYGFLSTCEYRFPITSELLHTFVNIAQESCYFFNGSHFLFFVFRTYYQLILLLVLVLILLLVLVLILVLVLLLIVVLALLLILVLVLLDTLINNSLLWIFIFILLFIR